MDDKEKIGSSIKRMREDISEQREKKKKLKQMELFVLDNSLRESTVGQLRGHTIDNKWKIYEQVLILFHWRILLTGTDFSAMREIGNCWAQIEY